MYPFQNAAPFIRQSWYCVAMSSEVGRSLLARTILDEPIVLYRTEAGEPVAMPDMCPHRMLPLSKGKLCGDEVACGYHGYQFDRHGRCTKIPTQDSTPQNFRMRIYPLIERGNLIWIWMGDADKAATTPLPDIEAIGIGNPAWSNCGLMRLHLKARWMLLVDNLFDLSHISWVHAKSIENADSVAKMVPIIEEDGQRFRVVRRSLNVPINKYHRWLHPQAPDHIDIDLYTEMLNPGIINAGSDDFIPGSHTNIGSANFIHIFTPETAHTTHYFSLVTRSFRVDDEGLSHAFAGQLGKVLQEDCETLEAVEPMAERYGDPRRELSGVVDAGGIRLRRKLEAMLEADAR